MSPSGRVTALRSTAPGRLDCACARSSLSCTTKIASHWGLRRGVRAVDSIGRGVCLLDVHCACHKLCHLHPASCPSRAFFVRRTALRSRPSSSQPLSLRSSAHASCPTCVALARRVVCGRACRAGCPRTHHLLRHACHPCREAMDPRVPVPASSSAGEWALS